MINAHRVRRYTLSLLLFDRFKRTFFAFTCWARKNGGVMHDRGPRHGLVLPEDQNISGTFLAANDEDSAEAGLESAGCVFIEPYTWPPGFPPFCGRPVVPGSPYCATHAARCAAPQREARR
jgi:hypothetical protein